MRSPESDDGPRNAGFGADLIVDEGSVALRRYFGLMQQRKNQQYYRMFCQLSRGARSEGGGSDSVENGEQEQMDDMFLRLSKRPSTLARCTA